MILGVEKGTCSTERCELSFGEEGVGGGDGEMGKGLRAERAGRRVCLGSSLHPGESGVGPKGQGRPSNQSTTYRREIKGKCLETGHISTF